MTGVAAHDDNTLLAAFALHEADDGPLLPRDTGAYATVVARESTRAGPCRTVGR